MQITWDRLEAQDHAPRIFGCFECTDSHALQANSCLSHKSFQTIHAVRLHLKCTCLNREEYSTRKALRVLWFTEKHILQKRSNEVAKVYGITNTAQSKTLSSIDWQAHTKNMLISFFEGRTTRFLLPKKLQWTVKNTSLTIGPAEACNSVVLPAVMHPRFARSVQEH